MSIKTASATPIPKRARLPGDERKRSIVHIAFVLLSKDGFEGFRTRDVAEQCGVTSATLHHYFATKEDLIEAVASHLEGLYGEMGAPKVKERDGESPYVRDLRQELADARFLRQKRPEMLAVSREFALRAIRDERIRALIDRLTNRWTQQLQNLLTAGQSESAFRADIDPPSTAGLIVSAIWGATALLGVSDAEFDRFCNQIERWLVPQLAGRKRRHA
jgi:AcrR family transcriptional regulator